MPFPFQNNFWLPLNTQCQPERGKCPEEHEFLPGVLEASKLFKGMDLPMSPQIGCYLHSVFINEQQPQRISY